MSMFLAINVKPAQEGLLSELQAIAEECKKTIEMNLNRVTL